MPKVDASSLFDDRTTELVFAFVGSLGTDLAVSEKALSEQLQAFGYETVPIRVSDEILPRILPSNHPLYPNEASRKGELMSIGTYARDKFGDGIVACGIAAEIARRRDAAARPRLKTAYIIHSLKHPEEVRVLRQIYPRGFYLVAVNVPKSERRKYLVEKHQIPPEEADRLIERDRSEPLSGGQNVLDTFNLADFFVGWGNDEQVANSVRRFVRILFGDPYQTPTFGEYAMFMAFAVGARSADLSRQVGAVVTRNDEILSTGANDCPKKGGGLYWPEFDPEKLDFRDTPRGRDYTRGEDSNKKAQAQIISSILNACAAEQKDTKKPLLDEETRAKLGDILRKSRIRDLTEFGRVVHAEMEALLSCARRGIPTVEATVYVTTYPCHNCGKHIIAAGIRKVVFIEPYEKSLARENHDEVIRINYPQPNPPAENAGEAQNRWVDFEPFFGVGPRRFLDLFSMTLSVGDELIRKNKSGTVIEWEAKEPRIKMRPPSYLEAEQIAAAKYQAIFAQSSQSAPSVGEASKATDTGT